MSQAELASMLKISASAVGMYEQGRREPSLDILVKLAVVFGVSTDFLLTGAVQTEQEARRVFRLLDTAMETVDARLDRRQVRPFSRQELMLLMAAILTEP